MTKYFDTEGERIIEFFLCDENIKYRKQQKISMLYGDDHEYRTPDFYLPQYKVYVEFFGKWNDPETKKKYIKKSQIYKKNNIPCVYLFPDNLGTLRYIFYMRLEEEFKKYPNNLRFQFLKYKLKEIIKMLSVIWSAFFIIVFIMLLASNLSNKNLTLPLHYELLILSLFLLAIISTIYTLKNTLSKK